MNKERMANKREIINANRKAKNALIKLVNTITNDLNLDEDRMAKRIDSALRSEYGPINGLINLIVSISQWPAEPGDGAMVSQNRMLLENKHNLDLLLLDDIKQFKGYHSFVTDELEIIDGVEPQYEDYTDYCAIFLEDLGVESYKATIEQSVWEYREQSAIKRAKDDLELKKEELARYKSLVTPVEARV